MKSIIDSDVGNIAYPYMFNTLYQQILNSIGVFSEAMIWIGCLAVSFPTFMQKAIVPSYFVQFVSTNGYAMIP